MLPLLLLPFALFACPAVAGATEGAVEPPTDARPTLWLVGDSTVRVSTEGQVGWGQVLDRFIDPARVRLENRAIGGRSTRTFLKEGRWAQVVAALKPGDFVLVQFGHNDSSPVNDDRRARGTLPGIGDESVDIVNQLTGEDETVYTYGAYLRRFVREGRAAGATVILLSPVPRNRWTDARVDRIESTYGGWARAVAAEEGAEFLDLNELVALRYEELGPAGTDPLFGGDHTHTNEAGALVNARAVIALFRGHSRRDGSYLPELFHGEAAADIPPTALMHVPADPGRD